MTPANINLSPAEWKVMEYLWENPPATGRQVAAYCAGRVGWSRTTSLTMLRHLLDKGAVVCDDSGPLKLYTPLVQREDAQLRETDDFLRRVYQGSVSLMLSALTKRQELSKEEISALRDILRQAESEVPQ